MNTYALSLHRAYVILGSCSIFQGNSEIVPFHIMTSFSEIFKENLESPISYKGIRKETTAEGIGNLESMLVCCIEFTIEHLFRWNNKLALQTHINTGKKKSSVVQGRD